MSGNEQQRDLGIPSFTSAEANRAINDYFYNNPTPEMSQPRKKKKKQLTYGTLRRSTRLQRSGNVNAFVAIQEDPDSEMIMGESGLGGSVLRNNQSSRRQAPPLSPIKKESPVKKEKGDSYPSEDEDTVKQPTANRDRDRSVSLGSGRPPVIRPVVQPSRKISQQAKISTILQQSKAQSALIVKKEPLVEREPSEDHDVWQSFVPTAPGYGRSLGGNEPRDTISPSLIPSTVHLIPTAPRAPNPERPTEVSTNGVPRISPFNPSPLSTRAPITSSRSDTPSTVGLVPYSDITYQLLRQPIPTYLDPTGHTLVQITQAETGNQYGPDDILTPANFIKFNVHVPPLPLHLQQTPKKQYRDNVQLGTSSPLAQSTPRGPKTKKRRAVPSYSGDTPDSDFGNIPPRSVKKSRGTANKSPAKLREQFKDVVISDSEPETVERVRKKPQRVTDKELSEDPFGDEQMIDDNDDNINNSTILADQYKRRLDNINIHDSDTDQVLLDTQENAANDDFEMGRDAPASMDIDDDLGLPLFTTATATDLDCYVLNTFSDNKGRSILGINPPTTQSVLDAAKTRPLSKKLQNPVFDLFKRDKPFEVVIPFQNTKDGKATKAKPPSTPSRRSKRATEKMEDELTTSPVSPVRKAGKSVVETGLRVKKRTFGPRQKKQRQASPDDLIALVD